MKEKKYLVLGTVILIVLLVFGVSYSFYKARIEGDTKSISLKTKGIYLLYKGDLNLVSEYIEPGWSVTKTFTIENQGSEIEKYNIYIKDLVNTFVTEGYLQYKITSSNGYNMSEYKDIPKAESKTDTVLAYSVTINPKEEQQYTIELIYKDTEENQSEDMEKILSGTLNIQEGTINSVPLLTAILRDNPTISERTDFSITNTANTTGTIYQTNKTEDGSTVYYYSGNTTNNWVHFGGFYWRIIRTNEDGSVRILYSGTSHDTTSGYIGKQPFEFGKSYDYLAAHYSFSMYVGYMYGYNFSLKDNRTNEFSSTIKTYIDNWYESNLLTNYDNYLSKTAIYCNDRSTQNNSYSTKINFDYASNTRLDTNKTPTYKCGGNTSNGLFESTQAVEDKFSVSTEGGGNGLLKYPIALMTADEVSFAGGTGSTELSSPYAWYYTNSVGESVVGDLDENYNSRCWWTLSPKSAGSGSPMVFCTIGEANPGYLGANSVEESIAVRPAISLSPCVKVTGSGTPENPYVVDYDKSCN